MVAMETDWHSSPLKVLQARFASLCRLPPGPTEGDADVWATLTEGALDANPVTLSGSSAVARPPPGALVRFRGMAQDIFDQEMYLWRYTGDKTTLADDESPVGPIDMQTAQFGDRLPVYCVSVPAETEWCKRAQDDKVHLLPAPNTSRSKRGLGQNDNPSEANEIPGHNNAAESAPLESSEPPKRTRAPASITAPAAPKVETVDPDEATSAPFGLNLPLESDAAKGSMAVLLKLYAQEHMKAARLNRVFDVVGVVSYAGGEIDELACSEDADLRAMEGGRNPSGMMIPRIHVLHLDVVETLRTNPLTAKLTAAEMPAVQHELITVLPVVRSMLVDLFASVLGGDHLAAEYLLIAAIARVQARPGTFIVGRLPLNVVIPPSLPSAPIIEALQAVLPRIAVIPVTVDSLNASPMIPAKDYSQNRLRAAPLQQPDGTMFVLDETNLQAGQLASRGMDNVLALRNLCQKAVVNYDFKFYKTDLPVSTPIVILTRTGRSMINSDFTITVCPTSAPVLCTPLSDELLHKLRLFLALVADGPWDLEIPESTSKAAEESFVAARQGEKDIRAETLEKWLTVARLSARSHGESVLSQERWNACFSMESERRSRVKISGEQ